jgi:hypothetical protein
MDLNEQWSVANTRLSSYESGFVRGVLYHRHRGGDPTVAQFLSALQLYETYRQFCRACAVDPATQDDPGETEGLSYAEAGFRDALVFIRYGIVHAADVAASGCDATSYDPEPGAASLH